MASASPNDESLVAVNTSSSDPQQVHAHACVTCAQRKVKCDRLEPCSNCEKSQTDCEYRDPAPPKRRKRKQPLDEETLAKLDRYEKLLNNLGVDLGSPSVSTGDARSPADQQTDNSPRRGSNQPWRHIVSESSSNGRKYAASGRPDWGERLIIDGHKSRYVENNLWGSLSEDVGDSKGEKNWNWYDTDTYKSLTNRAHNLRERGPSTLLFGNNALLSPDELLKLHPSVENMRKLWILFRENFDPLIKLFDIIVKETMFFKAAPRVADGSFRIVDSFFFSIYFCGITSIDEDECLKTFKETKATLLDRYQMGTEQALINSNLLNSSDNFVLQALILYLMCMRHRADAGSIWILSGVAIRMAQRCGLHRDAEKVDGNTWPWNAELRRRCWFQILMLDGRISELSGLGHSVWASFRWDTKQPLNINDSDLQTDAVEYPPERVGATDMIFCSIGYEIGNAFRSILSPLGTAALADLSEREEMIDRVEKNVENKYLRYCDPLVPLHQLCSIISRAAFASMRFKVNHPRGSAGEGQSAPQQQKDRAFSLALKVLEYYNLAYSTKTLKKFSWFIRIHFPWAQCVYLIGELQHLTSGSEVERALNQLDELIEHHPEVVQDQTRTIHVAFANFALRIWDARVKNLGNTPQTPDPNAPAFIQTLQRSRLESKPEESESLLNVMSDGFGRLPNVLPIPNSNSKLEAQPLPTFVHEPAFPPMGYNNELDIDPNNSIWPQWDDLIFQDPSFTLGIPHSLDQAVFFGQNQ